MQQKYNYGHWIYDIAGIMEKLLKNQVIDTVKDKYLKELKNA